MINPLKAHKTRILLIGICVSLYTYPVRADPLIDSLANMIDAIYGVAAGIAALLIVLQAVKYKTAAGPVERDEAKRGILNVVMGLAILLVAGYVVGLIYYVEPVKTPAVIPRAGGTTRIVVSTPTPSSTTSAPPGTTTSSSVPVTTTAQVKLTVMYVPVDWQGALSGFDSAVAGQAGFLISNIPLKDCPASVRILKSSTVCTINVPLDQAGCNAQTLNIIRKIEQCAKAEGKPYDYAVGLTNVDICGQVLGFSIQTGVVIAESSQALVTTHELSHEWGLNDEYVDACRCGFAVNPRTNCLDASIGGSDPAPGYTAAACAGGNQCPGYTKTCEGNKNPSGGRCIMSHAIATEPRAYCTHCWSHLITVPMLKC